MTNEDTAVAITLTGSDLDLGDEPADVHDRRTGPTAGTLGPIEPIDATSARVSYTPALELDGRRRVHVPGQRRQPDLGVPATAIAIDVVPVNDAPVATPSTASGPTRIAAVTIRLSGTDVDLDGDPLTFTVVTRPATRHAERLHRRCRRRPRDITYTPGPGLDRERQLHVPATTSEASWPSRSRT